MGFVRGRVETAASLERLKNLVLEKQEENKELTKKNK